VISGVLVILSYLFQDKPILILIYTMFMLKLYIYYKHVKHKYEGKLLYNAWVRPFNKTV